MKEYSRFLMFFIIFLSEILLDFEKKINEYEQAFQKILDDWKAQNRKISLEELLAFFEAKPKPKPTDFLSLPKIAENSDIIKIKRIYHPEYTGGEAYFNGNFISQTLELAWRENKRSISCIPEGIYEVVRRHTPKRGWHLHVTGVPNRDWILIHVMNDVTLNQKLDGNQDADSAGCIGFAEALQIRGGNLVGVSSTAAIRRINDLAFASFDKKKKVYLQIENVHAV